MRIHKKIHDKSENSKSKLSQLTPEKIPVIAPNPKDKIIAAPVAQLESTAVNLEATSIMTVKSSKKLPPERILLPQTVVLHNTSLPTTSWTYSAPAYDNVIPLASIQSCNLQPYTNVDTWRHSTEEIKSSACPSSEDPNPTQILYAENYIPPSVIQSGSTIINATPENIENPYSYIHPHRSTDST